jgi:hypothetical protein
MNAKNQDLDMTTPEGRQAMIADFTQRMRLATESIVHWDAQEQTTKHTDVIINARFARNRAERDLREALNGRVAMETVELAAQLVMGALDLETYKATMLRLLVSSPALKVGDLDPIFGFRITTPAEDQARWEREIREATSN